MKKILFFLLMLVGFSLSAQVHTLTGIIFRNGPPNASTSNLDEFLLVRPTGQVRSLDLASLAARINAELPAGNFTQEEIEDFIAAMITTGTQTNIVITYDDVNSQLDFVVNAPGLDTEEVEDVVGGLLVGGTGVTATYNDVAGTLTVALSGAEFTTLDETKLDGIEAAATADQTGAEIKVLYEAEANTNAYDDAAVAKLAGIEDNATADQTASEVPIIDAGLLITATDVEGALQELANAIDIANNAEGVSLDTTNFDNILSPTENNVQLAIEVLENQVDQDNQTAAEVPVSTANFNNNLGPGDSNVQVAFETLDDLIAAAAGSGSIFTYTEEQWLALPQITRDTVNAIVVDVVGNAIQAVGVSYNNTESGLTATNVQHAIDEVDSTQDSVVTEIAINPTSSFDFYTLTTNANAFTPYFADNAIVSLDYNGETLTIPKDSIEPGEAIRIVLDSNAGGIANIVPADSVLFLGFADGLSLDSYPSGVTLVRRNSTTVPNRQYMVTDYFGSITALIGAYESNNEYTEASAVNADNYTASLGSWTDESGNLDGLTLSGDAPVTNGGSSGSIRYQHVSGSDFDGPTLIYSDPINPGNAIETGVDYKISFWYKRVTGSATADLQLFINQSPNYSETVTTNTTGTWTFWESSVFQFNSTTPSIRVANNFGEPTAGDFYFTNFTLVKQ